MSAETAPHHADAARSGAVLSSEAKPEWLTTEALSELLGIPLATIRHWRYVGTGPAYVKLGRAVRYSRAVVERWISERARGGDLSSAAATR